MRIKERLYKKFNRKTNDYDREVNIFAKYQIGRIQTSEKSGCRSVEVIGPKQTFVLLECVKPLKVYRPEQPVKELRLFFVSRGLAGGVCKLQGATHFALENDELIAYKVSGGFAEEV